MADEGTSAVGAENEDACVRLQGHVLYCKVPTVNKFAMHWLILGGIATALAFPFGPLPTRPAIALWPLAWIGLTPLLTGLMKSESMRQAVRCAFIFGCAWMFVDCVWVFRVFDVLGWVLIWVPIGWIVLFGIVAFHARRVGMNLWLAWPLLWIGIEFIRSEWTPLRFDLLDPHWDPLRFSWLVLGHSRVTEPILAQSADLGGGYLLSLAPFLINLLLAVAWHERRVSFRPILVVSFLIAFELGYGAWRMARGVDGPAVSSGVVQSERENLPVLVAMTDSMLRDSPQTRLVVWPEESFSERSGDLDQLRELSRRHNIYLIAGVERPTNDGHHQNLALVVSPNGSIGTYHKRERVPFVETHSPSHDVPTFPISVDGDEFRLGVAICYDMDFPTTARELVRHGAQLLAVPTLDEGGWGATQHWQHALFPRLRAIENRRCVVQAATSGVSQIIDHCGRVLAAVPFRLNRRPQRPTLYLEGTATGNVRALSELSLYTRGGYWCGPAIAVAALIVVAVSLVKRPTA